MKKRFLFYGVAGSFLVLYLVGCQGEDTRILPVEGGLINNPGKKPPSGEVSVAVNPPIASVLTGDTLQLSASVSGTEDQRVTWSVVEGPSCGSITSGGLYTAPSTAPESGKCHIRATSVADPSQSATAEITITSSVVGCVAPTIPGFSGYVDIFSAERGQVDGPIGPNGTAAIDIDHATGIVDDGRNHFFIPDGNGGIRKIDLNVTPGQMTTVINASDWSNGGGSGLLTGIALLPNGDILVSDGGVSVIWRVTQSGQMSLFAGEYDTSGYADGPATGGGEGGNALFNLNEAGLTVGPNGEVYVADDENCAIRKISNGQVSTIAITPNSLNSRCPVVTPSPGAIVTDLLVNPTGVTVDCNGNILVAAKAANRILRVILTGPNAGQVVTVAGTGAGYDSTDNTDPLQADFCYPIAISVDRDNNIIVSDHCGTFRRIAAGQNIPGADGTAPNGEVTSPLGYEQPGPPLEYIAFTKDGNPVLVINSQRIALTYVGSPPPGY